MNLHDKPLAVSPLLSYRYRGRYGWIMIGAMDDDEALREAQRSTDTPVTRENLQRWSDYAYFDVDTA